ncbi:MAG TPA: FeoB small GTPase domain-containing protein, partial [Synergistales bacterium]|nr:FeoB small GTPase domain-containing protein [Synergistales bacterium]
MNCSDCSRCPHHKHFHHPPGSDENAGKILLVGNPNVGKSAIFSRLTGVHALSSNYPGTTIGFNEGWLRLEK